MLSCTDMGRPPGFHQTLQKPLQGVTHRPLDHLELIVLEEVLELMPALHILSLRQVQIVGFGHGSILHGLRALRKHTVEPVGQSRPDPLSSRKSHTDKHTTADYLLLDKPGRGDTITLTQVP